MKVNKFVLVLTVAMCLAFLLSACTPMQGLAQGVVDLPNTVEADITALALVAVSWLIVQLVTLLPFLSFLEEFKTPLALAISSQLIGFIEGAVPDAYGAVVILAIQLLLAVVALFMTVETLRKRNVAGFRPLLEKK